MADSIYRFSDGTLPNTAQRQCPLYEWKGIVRVQGTTEIKVTRGELTKQSVTNNKTHLVKGALSFLIQRPITG